MTGATIFLMDGGNFVTGTNGARYFVLGDREEALLVLREKATGALTASAWCWDWANGDWADPRGPYEALVSVTLRRLSDAPGPWVVATVEEVEQFLAEVAGLLDGTVDDVDVFGAVEALAERYYFGNLDWDDYEALAELTGYDDEEAS